jgi:hypothetical protein
MIVAITITAATLSPAWAYRVLEQLEQAYELQLGQVRLPDGANGTVVFTPCSTCTTQSLRVTQETTYTISGSPVDLLTLREQADSLRATVDGQTRAAVYIFYDPASLRVRRLTLSP